MIRTAAIAKIAQWIDPLPESPTFAHKKPANAATTIMMTNGMNSTLMWVRDVVIVCSPSIMSLRGRVMHRFSHVTGRRWVISPALIARPSTRSRP